MAAEAAPLKVLVTGASGYVGSRLVPRLLADGHDVRVSLTHTPEPGELWWLDQVEAVTMDVMEPDDVDRAVDGMDAVYYLIHGLGGEDFLETDRKAARTMAASLEKHGTPRVVYLSGIVPPVPEDEQSDHIASRLEVEQILEDVESATVITCRAAILLGAASTSFEIVRQISERLPLQTVPTWMRSDVQPIALVDALEALVGALHVDTVSRSYDIGGQERLSYPDLIAAYAEVAGLKRVQVSVPLLPTNLVGALAGRLTEVPAGTVESLVESLHHDMVCADTDFRVALLPTGHDMLDVRTAIGRALRPALESTPPQERDPMGPLPQDPDWAHGETVQA